MTTTIITKNSSTASGVPLAADLTAGELAVNLTDKRLFSKLGSTVFEVGTNPSAIALSGGTGLPIVAGTTGTLSTARGGTALTSFTANGVVYASSTSALATGSALTFDGTNFATTGRTTALDFLSTGGGLYLLSSGSTYGSFTSAVNSATLNANNGSSLIFQVASSEQMRLTSTGLGIGTSSPSEKLTVSGNVAIPANSFYKMGTGNYLYSDGSNTVEIAAGTSGKLTFVTNGAQRATLDSAGNLGLGVTPNSAWTDFTVFQNREAAIAGYPGQTHYTQNAYYQAGTWKYISGGIYATRYSQLSGQHTWWRSTSAQTAGTDVTFTQAMTLDASGNLLVGTTSSSGNAGMQMLPNAGACLTSINHVTGTASGNLYTTFNYNGASIGSITQAGTTGVLFNVTSDYRLKDIDGPVTTSGAFIDSLKPVQGSWKADGSRFIGFLAHELQEASETVVGTGVKDGEEMQSIDYSNAELVANLVAELQSLRKRVAALEPTGFVQSFLA